MRQETKQILTGLMGKPVCVTYVSPELTLSFGARVESVLDNKGDEVVLLLSEKGRIIASGVHLRRTGNGIVVEVGAGKRLYITQEADVSGKQALKD
jgi:hypothetical protein